MNFTSILAGISLASILTLTFPQSVLALSSHHGIEGIPYRHCLVGTLFPLPRSLPESSLLEKVTAPHAKSDCDEANSKWNRLGLEQFAKLTEDQANASYALLQPDEKIIAQINACTKQTEELHKAAMRASESVYDPFPPEGYSTITYFENKKTGFRAMLIEPKALPPGVKPHVMIAIAGTKDLKDVSSDLAFGRSQYIGEVAEVVKWASYYLQEKDVVFTGHSLGGGLAQAMAYATQENLIKNGKHVPNKIHIVTWNAFGGKQLLETTGPSDKPRSLRSSIDFDPADFGQVVNYRLAGDVVSRLGTHLGELRTISPVPKERQFTAPPASKSPLKLHFINTIMDATFSSRLSDSQPTRLKDDLVTSSVTSVLNYSAQSNAIWHWLFESLAASVQSEKKH